MKKCTRESSRYGGTRQSSVAEAHYPLFYAF